MATNLYDTNVGEATTADGIVKAKKWPNDLMIRSKQPFIKFNHNITIRINSTGKFDFTHSVSELLYLKILNQAYLQMLKKYSALNIHLYLIRVKHF